MLIAKVEQLEGAYSHLASLARQASTEADYQRLREHMQEVDERISQAEEDLEVFKDLFQERLAASPDEVVYWQRPGEAVQPGLPDQQVTKEPEWHPQGGAQPGRRFKRGRRG